MQSQMDVLEIRVAKECKEGTASSLVYFFVALQSVFLVVKMFDLPVS